uniref:Uncharacterized protein n=1 Tax=Fagus sylvatica TaxID=28930 RepID=A0A2N9F500_FAGSY
MKPDSRGRVGGAASWPGLTKNPKWALRNKNDKERVRAAIEANRSEKPKWVEDGFVKGTRGRVGSSKEARLRSEFGVDEVSSDDEDDEGVICSVFGDFWVKCGFVGLMF